MHPAAEPRPHAPRQFRGPQGRILGPLLVAYLFNHYGYSSVFVYIAATWVVVAVTIGAFGPATSNRPLT